MEPSDEGEKPSVWHLIATGLASVAIVGGFYAAGILHFAPDKWQDFGSFVGGAAGVLLTALTFLALLYTIYIQSTELALSRQELRLTRDEMKLNREEVARSAEALNKQVNAIEVQSFERTLFDSLRFLNDVVAQFEHKSAIADEAQTGTRAFLAMYQDLHARTELRKLETDDGDQIGADEQLNTYFDLLSPQLGTYFRTLYNIYRYLDESNYSDQVYYNRIIRAQIPNLALVLLFYNSLTDRGLKFQKYIEKYRILDNMLVGMLANPKHAQVLEKLPTQKAGQKISGNAET